MPETPIPYSHHQTDTDINKLPRRRTDGARIVDTEEHSIKLYTTPGGSKLIKRCEPYAEQQGMRVDSAITSFALQTPQSRLH